MRAILVGMSEEKTPEALAEALDRGREQAENNQGSVTKRRPKNSTPDAADKEPKPESVDPAASAEPATVSTTPYAVVSGAAVDPIRYSKAVRTPKHGPRKSLTVLHIQRRLHELGHPEGWSETIYGDLTASSVSSWQTARGDEPTGILTVEQFQALFEGDPNVDIILDTMGDNPID